ncbi:MAG: squalene/phytoene synthase family protein [Gammaproteobacteria bacterium]
MAVSTAAADTLHPARAPGSDFYYASLYHRPALRETLRAAAALRAELLAIPASCSDRGVAHVKLAWWHDELARADGSAPRHVLTQALQPLFAREPAWRETCLGLVERLNDALSATERGDEDALRAWFDALHGDFAQRLARLATPRLALADATVRAIAVDTELLRAVLELRAQRQAGPLPFDHATLARHGLSAGQVRDARRTTALGALVSDTLTTRRDRLVAAIAALPRHQRRHARLAVTGARLVLRATALTLADGAAVLERRVEATPVDKLFIAWRTRYVG